MYGIIRILIGIVLFMVSFVLIKRSKTVNKRKWNIISVVSVLLIVICLYSVPVENLFILFPSPEESFNYTNFGKAEVELIVEGRYTDYIVAKKNDDTFVTSIIPKVDEGWKLGVGFDTKTVKHSLDEGVSIYIYRYKNTDEYYITVLDTNGGSSEISDSCGSEFSSISIDNNATGKTYYHYYAYITDYNDYAIEVNGIDFQF